MLSFAEEIFLLALDDKQGVIKPLPVSALDYALAGALLMDLALQDRIDTDLTSLSVTNTQLTGDPILDDTLRDIQQKPESQPTSFWLKYFADQSRRIQERVLARLIQKGILKQENRRILWVFEVRRYPLMDNHEVKEVKTRLRELILGDDIPDSREVVLINLGNACRLLDDLFTPAEYEQVRSRITALARLDLIGQEMAKSIREIERTMAIAMSMTMMA
ncbi:MAG: GPP34 family phosphoprotein [Verrucomicrobiota bacterium]